MFLKVLTAIVVSAVSTTVSSTERSVVSSENVEWGYLNPLRGDKSPAAADLWGDRTKDVPTGMLVKFNKGFSSPPHIHNISYRGIVIEGLMHNDDPTAENMWLPTASYWTQPAGQNHITAANGESNMIYLEIDSGPYLVKPSKQKFDNGEYPVNLHSSNLVWLTQDQTSMLMGRNLAMSLLWKSSSQDTEQGYLLKLTDDSNVQITSNASEFRAVVIKGKIDYVSAEPKDTEHLLPGSYFGSSGMSTHKITGLGDAIVYIRTNALFQATSGFEPE